MSHFFAAKRFLAAIVILPFLLVTSLFSPSVADTGTDKAPGSVPTTTVQTIFTLVGAADVSAALPFPTPVVKRLVAPPTTVATPRINGFPLDRIVVMPQAVQQHVREIYAQGQALGRNAHAFSKVGDSTMVYPPFLAAFAGSYRLGNYGSLQTTIDWFPGSFARESMAAKKSMHTWSEFDPTWADAKLCQPNEGPLACELRLHNPSIAIIRLGANDASAPTLFNTKLRDIIETCLDRGIIPVLGTKPDRVEGPQNTINKLVIQASREYAIPLWDYDTVVSTIPGKGLVSDKVHFRAGGSRDYASAAAFKSGDSLEDLTGLMMLDAIQRAVK